MKNKKSILPFDDKSEDFEAVNFNIYPFNKENFQFEKLPNVRFCVLELSKLKLYEWYLVKKKSLFWRS